MIVRYHQVDEAVRDHIRLLENKGHIAYIRYLLLQRTDVSKINAELARIGLSSAREYQYVAYFDEVLYPIIERLGLTKYYKQYKSKRADKVLTFAATFEKNDIHRTYFCELIKETETDAFFGKECVKYYGLNNVPTKDDGMPIITAPKEDWLDLLLHDKRHIIDGMLAEGHSSNSISKHFDAMYDIQLSKDAINNYSKSFMNVQRKDLEKVIEEVEKEKKTIQDQMEYVRSNEELFTIGERITAVSSLKGKLEQLDGQLRRLRSAHGNASYAQGVLEFSNMREMFSDIMLRTHRRYKMMDERTEDAIVDPLSKLINMMSKATDKIVGLESIMSETTKKSISEEMLEVVIPTLDRVEEEERNAMAEYREAFKFKDIENEDVMGMDDED